jgi:hypothetical protein
MTYVGSRFGQDGPPRIATSAELLLEATELPPIPNYQALIPFIPTTLATTDTSAYETLSDGHLLWRRTPARCDLMFYQGDDVVIPLYFDDPALTGDDMELGYTWHSQIRVIHSYRSTLVNTFTTHADYTAASTGVTEATLVELFLPRSLNTHWGLYRWDLYSVSTKDYSRFPKPDDVEVWPPPDELRTWLYGLVRIAPRVTSTDALPAESTVPTIGGPAGPVALSNGGFAVGPNGRVP